MSGFAKILGLYFIFLLSCLAAVHLTGKSFKKINGVAVANEQNIRSMLHNYQNVVLFFTDSKNYLSTNEYQTFQNITRRYTNEKEYTIIFARVQKSDIGNLLSQYKVDQFPSLVLARKNKFYGFSGSFGQIDLDRWIQRKGISPCLKLEDENDFKIAQTQYDLSVVHTPNSPIALDKLIEIARESEVFTCFHTYNRSLASHDFYLISEFQPQGVELNLPEVTLEKLDQAVKQLNVPGLIEFDNKAIKLVFQKEEEMQAVFLLTRQKNNPIVKELKKLADSRKGKRPYVIHSAADDGHGENFKRLVEYLGLKETDITPENCVVTAINQEDKYRLDGPVNSQTLEKFISDYNSGRLKRFKKSEPAPTENNEPVRVIVGQTFQSEVIDNDKDVLVEFYAPWCGHCKSLAPIYEELAVKLKGNRNLIIAKIDSTQNEVDGIDIPSYPTIKFFKKGQKQKAIDFYADRTLEELLKFLKENTSHPWVE